MAMNGLFLEEKSVDLFDDRNVSARFVRDCTSYTGQIQSLKKECIHERHSRL
jgi:hypothetical protein